MPTFNSYGDAVLISKYYRRGKGIEVGDVVSFAHPIRPEERAMKRVLGMPGDFVCRDTPGTAAKEDAMIIQVCLLSDGNGEDRGTCANAMLSGSTGTLLACGR